MLQIASAETLDEGALVLLPRLEVRASAGTGLVAESEAIDGYMALQVEYLRRIGINPTFARILTVTGNSMQPTLSDGDQIVVNLSIDNVVDNALYALVYGGLVLVKRVQLMRDGSVILKSDNRDAGYEDERVQPQELDQLRIVGRVGAHFRQM